MSQDSDLKQARRLGRRDVVSVVGLVLFTLVLVGSSLPRRELWHPDETRFAVVARTMHETGNYLVPHLGSRLYREKPPLLFWLMNLAAGLTGEFSTVAVRLPTAAASAAAVVALYLVGRLFFDTLTSLLGGLVLATSVLFMIVSQFAITDPLLIALQTWALYCYLRGEYSVGPARRWYAGFWVLTALATLTKGPIGLVVPAAVLVPWVVLARGPGRLLRAGLLWGLPLYAAVVAAWLVPAGLQAGWPYVKYLLMNMTLWRITGSHYSQHRPWHYYLWTFFLNFWPWAVFVPEAMVRVARRWWRQRRSAEGGAYAEGLLLVVLWFVVVMAGWSVAGVKRVRYVMFGYPAAALAVGWLWAGVLRGRLRWSWATTGATLFNIGVLAAMAMGATVAAVPGTALWVMEHAPGDSSVPAADRAAALAPWRWGFAGMAATLAVLVVGLVWLLLRRRSSVLLWVLLVPVVFQGHGVAWIFPMMNQFRCMQPVGEICRELRSRHPEATVALSRLSWTAAAWYAGTTDMLLVKEPKDVLAVLESDRPAFLIVEASHLERLQQREPRLRDYPRSERRAGVRRLVILSNRPHRDEAQTPAAGGGSQE